jgi:hypothetical protein
MYLDDLRNWASIFFLCPAGESHINFTKSVYFWTPLDICLRTGNKYINEIKEAQSRVALRLVVMVCGRVRFGLPYHCMAVCVVERTSIWSNGLQCGRWIRQVVVAFCTPALGPWSSFVGQKVVSFLVANFVLILVANFMLFLVAEIVSFLVASFVSFDALALDYMHLRASAFASFDTPAVAAPACVLQHVGVELPPLSRRSTSLLRLPLPPCRPTRRR